MNSEPTKNVIVIGAGLSGLTVAYRLKKQGHAVTVLEKENRAGGAIGSGRRDGFLWESGPNSGLDTTPLINELLDDLGIREERLGANKIADRRFIVRGGRLIPMPMSPMTFFGTPLFSYATKLGLLREPFISRSSPEMEESVAGFVRRRLGEEFLEYAVGPFVSGIYAGDPEVLSVQAAFPKLFALEQRYGSLIRGAILGARERKLKAEKSKNEAKSFSFKDGMQTFTDALAKSLNDVQLETSIESVQHEASGTWIVRGKRNNENKEWRAAAVVLSAPADVASALLAPFAEDAAAALKAISYAPVATLISVWKRDDIAHQLDGFGFLVPRSEGLNILGSLFSSSMFPYRANSDHAVLTTFIGGMRHPELPYKDDETLQQIMERDLSRLIHIKNPPLWTQIYRHPRAIPQYTFGHLQRIQRIDAAKKTHRGVFFCANWRGGIALGDCVKNGHDTADEIHAYFSETVPA
ncbi:MAG: protoporphyrinogen oxidase [Burkholderiales bacterium]|jgi:oxygen-dependent protoporphyrinogen oxidase|nr:protoporphyrinogen oxidase [Burkholderiales bacterium]